jgi:hypothetical protein
VAGGAREIRPLGRVTPAVRWDSITQVNALYVLRDTWLNRLPGRLPERRSDGASVIYRVIRSHGIVRLLMTHFPQPHPSRRAARVRLGEVVLAAIRLEDGRRTRAKLQSVSVTGGLLQMAQCLGEGDFVEVSFQTESGPVQGMAEILSPTRKTTAGVLQPFRFVALGDDDHRRLRMSVDYAADRSLLGLKSSAFLRT